MTTDTPPPLLPCPFCGGEAEASSSNTHPGDPGYIGWNWVACSDCGAQSDQFFDRDKTDEALAAEARAAWNRRVIPTSPPAGAVEGVVECPNCCNQNGTLTCNTCGEEHDTQGYASQHYPALRQSQPAPAVEGWRSIESAPIGKDILLCDSGIVGEGRYIEDEGWFWANTRPTDAVGPGEICPTCWMPLPAPPGPPEAGTAAEKKA